MLRLYDVDSGAIEINGINIKEYSIQKLRRNFSVYFQNANNFYFTVRDNISIADRDQNADDEMIIQAIADSGAKEVLEKAPKGLDTMLSRLFDNEGLELSVGQQQRFALARTFYRQHSMLILDEPTSSLDPRAEHDLFKTLDKLTDGKTVLFISHRLTNVNLADRIIVMEKGRIIEDGTKADLLAHKGRFAELYRYQQERYDLTGENAC